MNSQLIIGATYLSAAQRAAAGISLNELSRNLEGYDSVAFMERSLSPFPTFNVTYSCALKVDGNVVFQGQITDLQSSPSAEGWVHGYTALGLRYLADRVPITAVDGTGLQIYNRTPDDEYAVPTDVGLSLGTILTRILCIPQTANALAALGVGNYTTLSPPTLPAATLSDFAALTEVPSSPVVLTGEGIINQLSQLIQRWTPTSVLEIQPDGTIRAKDYLDATVFVPQTVTVPGTVAADPVTWPSVRKSIQTCATRVVFRGGPQVEAAFLSLVDGTLAEVFTSSDKSSWTLYAFTQPNGASDYGTVTAVTSNSVTVTSSSPSVSWVTNFWSTNEAWITLTSNVGTGINVSESRIVTSCTAMTAGGSATLSWDPSWPITNTNYTSYRVVGSTGGLINCWRDYTPREPATGATGLNTWIGSHLVTKAPRAVQWANATTAMSEYYTTAMIYGGSVPVSIPAMVQPVPSQGIFRFQQPTVTAFGSASKLQTGSPTTVADGLPIDVQVLALYSRGPLSVTVPPDVAGVPQYEGTAYTQDGLEVTRYMDYPGWIFANDAVSFQTLAQKHLDSTKNTVYEGSIDWLVSPTEPAWAWLSFGTALNIAISGSSSPWATINAPIRTIKVQWSSDPVGYTHRISFGFSNQMRAFTGDDLYLHPMWAQGNFFSGISSDSYAQATDLLTMLQNGGSSLMSEGRNSFAEGLGAESGQMKFEDPRDFVSDMSNLSPTLPSQVADPRNYGTDLQSFGNGFRMQTNPGDSLSPWDMVDSRPSQPRPSKPKRMKGLKGTPPAEQKYVPGNFTRTFNVDINTPFTATE